MPDLNDTSIHDVPNLMAAAQQMLSAGNPELLPHSAAVSFRILELLQREPVADEALRRRQLAAAWVMHGHALREQRTPASRTAAVKAYDEALSQLDPLPMGDDPAGRQELANIWTNRGRALLDENTKETLKAAAADFGKAVALRKTLPLDEDQSFRWGLTASLMNQGDALTRLGGKEGLETAIRCYDEAIGHLLQLPVEEHAGTRSRLAVAWMNRGITCQCQGTPEQAREAARSFGEAVQVVASAAAGGADQQGILASALMNQGNSLLYCEPPDAVKAREAGLQALAMVQPEERENPLAAEVGIKARHLLCRALATLLDAASPDEPQFADWITEATDAADDGMALVRHWTLREEPGFEPLGSDLFRFGCRIFQLRQPHFLAEFILDSLDPERSPGAPTSRPEMYHIAGEAVWNAVVDIQRLSPLTADEERRAVMVEILEDLQSVETRLAALREAWLAPSSQLA